MIPARVGLVAGAIAGAAMLVLAGCTEAPAATTTSAVAVPPSAAGSPSPAPVATLHATGTAAQNKAYFSLVTKRLLASNPKPTGREFIDNLVKAGFDKANMEVTPDKTAIGLTADAIEFSVKFGKECLVGQKGEEFGFTAVVVPVIETGTCLVGKTRAIDW